MDRNSTLFLPVLAAVFVACGGGSLEDQGRELGEKWCECKSIDWRYDAEVTEGVLDAMKADVTLSWDSAWSMTQRDNDKHGEDKERQEETCENEFKAMRTQLAIDFPKDEDRETLDNLLDAMRDQCKQQHEAEKEELEKAVEEARERNEQSQGTH